MSKFDAIYKRIEEQLPVTAQQQNQAAGVQTNTSTAQQTNPQQQQPQAQLKNPQAIEKIADELANINDPNKIKLILNQLMQGLTTPKTAG